METVIVSYYGAKRISVLWILQKAKMRYTTTGSNLQRERTL